MRPGSTAGNAGLLISISGTINSVTESAAYTHDNLGRLVTSNHLKTGKLLDRVAAIGYYATCGSSTWPRPACSRTVSFRDRYSLTKGRLAEPGIRGLCEALPRPINVHQNRAQARFLNSQAGSVEDYYIEEVGVMARTIGRVATVTGLAVVAMASLMLHVAKAQSRNRIVQQLIAPGISAPVSISNFKVSGLEVAFDREFQEGSDWVGAITFDVANTSGKGITHFAVDGLVVNPDVDASKL